MKCDIILLVLMLAIFNFSHYCQGFSAGAGTIDGRRSLQKVKGTHQLNNSSKRNKKLFDGMVQVWTDVTFPNSKIGFLLP